MYGKFQAHLQNELKEIKEAGLYKAERLIEGPQQAAIQVGVSTRICIHVCRQYAWRIVQSRKDFSVDGLSVCANISMRFWYSYSKFSRRAFIKEDAPFTSWYV